VAPIDRGIENQGERHQHSDAGEAVLMTNVSSA
jgi:hypothetical protein